MTPSPPSPIVQQLAPLSQRLDPIRTRPQITTAPATQPPQPVGGGGGGVGGRSGSVATPPPPTRGDVDGLDLIRRVAPIVMFAGLERVMQPIAYLPNRFLGAPSARESATWMVQHPVESVVAGGIGFAAGAAVMPLLASGGAVAGIGGAAVATGGVARGIGGAALGTGAGTAVVDTGIKLAVGAGLVGALASQQHRAVNLPSGLPDWMDKWQDPHGGIGGGGGEIPRPDWMSGDPEVVIDPGVDWRGQGESFEDYLAYRRELPSEGPVGRGPDPYYSGPEIMQPGPATRFINSPELPMGSGLGVRAPELMIGPESRTIASPEITTPHGGRFAPELPVNLGRDIFPVELPGERGAEPFRFPSEWGERLTGDRLVADLPTPKYSDAILSAGAVAIGRGRPVVPRGFTEEIIDHRTVEVPAERAVVGETPLDRLEASIMKDFGDLAFTHAIAGGPEAKARLEVGPLGRLENLARSQLEDLSGTSPLTIPDADVLSRAISGTGYAGITWPGLMSGTGTGSATAGLSLSSETSLSPRMEYVRMPNIPALEFAGVTVPEFPTEFPLLNEHELRRERRTKQMRMDSRMLMGSVTIENLTPTIESVFGRGGIKIPKFKF